MALIALLPISMGTIGGAASGIAIILLGISLVLAWSEWSNISFAEKLLFSLMAALFVVGFLSFINADDLAKSWTRLERLLRLLAFVPIFLLLRKAKLDLIKPLTLGMVVAGPALLLSALLTVQDGRSVGAYNPILFGDYGAIVCAYLITVVMVASIDIWKKAIALAAAVCAMAAMIMSETRGAWVAVAAATGWCGLIYIKAGPTRFQQWLRAIGAMAFGGVAVLVGLTNERVQERLGSAIMEFQGYLTDENPHTSLGFRLQMWEAAIKMWQKNPLLGTGLGDYSRDLAEMIRTGESKMTEHFGEAHSLLFEFLATTGIFGVTLCLLALFILPVWLLYRSRTKIARDTVVTALGTVILITFFVFGLTQNWLGRSSITSTYIILLAVVLASQSKISGQSRLFRD